MDGNYLLVEILRAPSQTMQQVHLTDVGRRALRRGTEELQPSCENAVGTGSR